MKKQYKKKQQQGFSLLELMIVVGIVGIISSIAYPSYMEHVKKSKRSDAKVELLKIAQMQESYFVQNLTYAKDLTSTAANGGLGLSSPVQSEQGEYTISMTAKDSGGGACTGKAADACTSFTLTATPVSTSGQAHDSACTRFTLSNTGKKGTSASATSAQIKACWK